MKTVIQKEDVLEKAIRTRYKSERENLGFGTRG